MKYGGDPEALLLGKSGWREEGEEGVPPPSPAQPSIAASSGATYSDSVPSAPSPPPLRCEGRVGSEEDAAKEADDWCRRCRGDDKAEDEERDDEKAPPGATALDNGEEAPRDIGVGVVANRPHVVRSRR